MFELIKTAPTDPILDLENQFQQDSRVNKINLGIGIYQDENGNTPILSSVKIAEKYILEKENNKNYLHIDGMINFGHYTQNLLFGFSNPVISDRRARTAQTPGGTSALRIAADFLATHTKTKRIWISNPSWPNHKKIFSSAGLIVDEYEYYDDRRHVFDFSNMKKSLCSAGYGDIVLFHGCCHNPTGIDPSQSEWQQLSEISLSRGWLPLFDCAYQGFAHGLEKDVQSIRLFASNHQELIICSSYSKNFGLYNERVGALTLVAKNHSIVNTTFSQIKAIIRAHYSNPPVHGAAIVTTILSDVHLRQQWEQELTTMRERIQKIRCLFVQFFKEKKIKNNFNLFHIQNGMFSLTGLTPKQITRLRDEFGIYIINSGRINIAGINLKNITPLCEAIITIL
ncbi:amino acid aminotransferase [Candidatus Erwinia haradaeae]|uniref:Aminotransferase n=1 Tax=Candidatus Erwinia haradaeae TaxID=1922217 RepID=A0A451D7M5_9GAMM|nr:amino acid aminotransferase [Candidatus Erwinia haradaeae]VFP81773.1 Aspartate aminotransferase [Candidatus Erwinia haradaeae]